MTPARVNACRRRLPLHGLYRIFCFDRNYERPEMKLAPVMEKFILHWGEMGARWGINRTVAQIHALLFLSPRPLHAEEIAETLGVARSNVYTSLPECPNCGK